VAGAAARILATDMPQTSAQTPASFADKAARAAPWLLLLGASVLFLASLGNICLWQDEAQTALVARTVLEGGLPRGTDGTNFFSQELGAEYGPGYLWRWHTWLPFYVLAGFFAALGESTLVARLPFALAGIATVVLAWAAGRRLWGRPRAGFLCGLLLLTSVPFLILARQCRWYSFAAFFALLALHAYQGVIARTRHSGALLVVALVLLFHTHYLYCAATCAALLVHALLLARGALRRTALLILVSAGLDLPWILWFSGMSYGSQYGHGFLSLAHAGAIAPGFVIQLLQYVVPPFLIPVALGLGALRWFRRRADTPGPAPGTASGVALLLLFLGANLAALSLSAPAPLFRYLAPLIPVCIVLMARIVEAAFAAHAVIGLALLATLVARQPLLDYLDEITHDFDGPIEGIARHLNQHGQPGQTVAITYGDMPVKFYTRMRVVGGLTGEDLTPALDADWVILRKHVVSGPDLRVREFLEQNIPWDRYESTRIDYPDTRFENRESPQEHRWRTDTGEERVVIWRRVR
jgi:4-amino-4-deoxy-L-arabinose transferase-like glycosyltransferase